jgi:uncharacterized protein (TIGR03435 family)
VYALTAVKTGPKLVATSYIEGQNTSIRNGPGGMQGTNARIWMLANVLSQQLGRSVVDKTGLTGTYHFNLEWTPDPSEPHGPGDPGQPAPDPSGPSIFTALQEQLGLKLESQKGPVEVIVIDRVEKPSEN